MTDFWFLPFKNFIERFGGQELQIPADTKRDEFLEKAVSKVLDFWHAEENGIYFENEQRPTLFTSDSVTNREQVSENSDRELTRSTSSDV